MRNGGFWFKVKVLSFKIRFCNGDSDAQLTPTTAHAQTLCVIAARQIGGLRAAKHIAKPRKPTAQTKVCQRVWLSSCTTDMTGD